jgi:ketosteroid isomerase-like protein
MSVASRVRRAAFVACMALGTSLTNSCTAADGPPLTAAERSAIADTLRSMIVAAYDLSKPGDAVTRLMSLYPQSGKVVSASGGQVSTSRDSIELGLRTFWENVGRNMREPKWTWGEMHVDVLAPDAAVVTTTYRVPHLTPRGEPHVFAGAWTAVFQRRGGRWVIVQEHLSDVPAATAMAHGS